MELEADDRHVLLFLLLSRELKIVVFPCHEWQRSEQESHVRYELFIVDQCRPEFTRMNLSASCYLARLYRCIVVRYLEYDQREHKSMRSISGEHEA
jgi:hypothetical protein